MSDDNATLAAITSELGRVYDSYKDFKKRLKGTTGKNPQPGYKQRFFNEATKAQASTLAQKTVRVDVSTCDEDPKAYAAKAYPRWVVKDVTYYDGSRDYDVLLEENPEFKPFTYVNQETQRVWTKQVVDGSPWLDDEELQAQDPELWDEVSDIPNRIVLENIIYECNVEPDEVSDRLEELWRIYEGPRVMKELEELTPDQLAAVQRYVYPGKPQVKLQAPRKAKPEELTDD